MHLLKNILFTFCFFCLSSQLVAEGSKSDKTEKTEKGATDPKAAAAAPKLASPFPHYVDPPVKEITQGQQKAECKKYNGKIIANSGEVYKVIHCKRYRLNEEEIYEVTRNYEQSLVKEVENITVAAIPDDGWYKDLLAKGKKFNCNLYEGKYVTFSYVDIYYVEKCKKRLFVDWETFLHHRGKNKKEEKDYIALELAEFQKLQDGEDMPSVIDHEYKLLLKIPPPIEPVPMEKICKKYIGKYVSYLDQIFIVEKAKAPTLDPQQKHTQSTTGLYCQRKRVDAEEFTRKLAYKQYQLYELTSEYAISIPIKNNPVKK